MIFFLTALFCFFLYVLVHALLVRAGVMKFQTAVLIVLALAGWGIYFFLSAIFDGGDGSIEGVSHDLWMLPLKMSSGIFYGLISLWYIAQCTAIQVRSPSMTIMRLIDDCGMSGLTYQELARHFGDEEFVIVRLRDLRDHGHVILTNEKYFLSKRGRLIAAIVKSYRDFIRRGMGG